MVAYNFQPEFVQAIKDGTKISTIRRPERRHARPGEHVQLFQGQRSPFCEKIIDDPVCVNTCVISMVLGGDNFRVFVSRSQEYVTELFGDALEYLAEKEGFASPYHMRKFFQDRYKLPFFVGTRITWEPPTRPLLPLASPQGSFTTLPGDGEMA